MKFETDWQKEWEVLRAERDVARRQWRSAADGLAARARDPFGLRSLVQDHPVAATGIGAALGAVFVKLFLGRKGARKGGAPRGDGVSGPDADGRPPPRWSTVLREVALSIAVPWLIRTLREKFGFDIEPAVAPEPDRPQPAAAKEETERV